MSTVLRLASNKCMKHLLHCISFIIFIIVLEICCGGLIKPNYLVDIDPWTEYGNFATIFLYSLRCVIFLVFPQTIFNFCGLVFYNAFPGQVMLKSSPLLAPFICIRVVTRGDFAELVKRNVLRNMNTCVDSGLENFFIEVVTEKTVQLSHHRRIREIVVPKDYKTPTGAKYKARALQYCLESYVNVLKDTDWIVHLDEETLLTQNSVRGILNFVHDGKHQFGQGLITYTNEKVVNWITTLADCFRVSDDLGKLRCQFKVFHKPLFSWKGSYIVAQAGPERHVSYDNGIEGSVAEDCFFALRAFAEGYSFDFIEGEMYEKSPFTLLDFMQQRIRWLKGILLVVHSKVIPWKCKILLGMSIYSWALIPFSSLNILFSVIYPTPCSQVIDFIQALILAVSVYMYLFGFIKSFSMYRLGFAKFPLYILCVMCIIPINIFLENLAVIWGLIERNNKFYVIQKDERIIFTV